MGYHWGIFPAIFCDDVLPEKAILFKGDVSDDVARTVPDNGLTCLCVRMPAGIQMTKFDRRKFTKTAHSTDIYRMIIDLNRYDSLRKCYYHCSPKHINLFGRHDLHAVKIAQIIS